MKRQICTLFPRIAVAVCLVVGALEGVLAEGAPDLKTPEAQALRKEWLEARAGLESERNAALTELLSRLEQTAKEQLARARVSGNMTQQAVARAAQQIFGTAAEDFKKDGKIELPETARREVQPVLDSARRSVDGIEAKLLADLKTVDREAAAKLRAILVGQGIKLDGDTQAEEMLPTLGKTEAPTVATKAGEGAKDGASEAAAPVEEPGMIASNGEADAWVPLMDVGVQVAVLEIVSIPVAGVSSERSVKETGLASQQEIAFRIVPHRTLAAPKAPVVFRAMSIPGKAKPDVMTWPSARNGWMLELRCRPRSSGDVHALRLEVAEGTAGLQ